MNILRWVLYITLFFTTQAYAGECVILLHGLARSNASMSKMESALIDAGFKTVNHNYPSTKHQIAELSENEIPAALEHCSPDDTVHFVTHSLGGILLRHYLSNKKLAQLGRVVMLGPPNKGSHIVDVLRRVPGYKLIYGPAGMQLGTDAASVPNLLDSAQFEVGIIAGNKNANFFLSSMVANPDDGTVSVESTKLEGMSDHIVLHVSHYRMMKDKEVIMQTLHFLQSGRFNHLKYMG